jgi:DNA-binding transcriptional MerR regulator
MPKLDISTALVTTKEMAKIIRVSPQTLDTWRKKNLIPHITIRHVIRFNPERVLAALAKLETKTASK